jgi:hypothetical protein
MLRFTNNPKVVKYEIHSTGTAATINYLDLTTTAPAASPNIIAQRDGVIKHERTTDGENAQTFCLVKSA